MSADRVRLIVAISSRALFDLSESHRIFETQGVDAYRAYQVAHEGDLLAPGVAFPLAKKLMNLNVLLGERGCVEVILLSRNTSDTGLRVLTSAHHHGLDITRAAFTGGTSPYRYVAAFGAQLFLSADPLDVRLALDALHSAEEQVKVAREGLELAENELTQARRRYDAGVAIGVEVTDAQTRLERARDNQTQAIYSYNVGRLDLAQAMGAVRRMVE